MPSDQWKQVGAPPGNPELAGNAVLFLSSAGNLATSGTSGRVITGHHVGGTTMVRTDTGPNSVAGLHAIYIA